jgi:hypothetical protein
LVARGVKGRLETWRTGKTHPDMIVPDIKEGARWTVEENDKVGPRIHTLEAHFPTVLSQRSRSNAIISGEESTPSRACRAVPRGALQARPRRSQGQARDYRAPVLRRTASIKFNDGFGKVAGHRSLEEARFASGREPASHDGSSSAARPEAVMGDLKAVETKAFVPARGILILSAIQPDACSGWRV